MNKVFNENHFIAVLAVVLGLALGFSLAFAQYDEATDEQREREVEEQEQSIDLELDSLNAEELEKELRALDTSGVEDSRSGDVEEDARGLGDEVDIPAVVEEKPVSEEEGSGDMNGEDGDDVDSNTRAELKDATMGNRQSNILNRVTTERERLHLEAEQRRDHFREHAEEMRALSSASDSNDDEVSEERRRVVEELAEERRQALMEKLEQRRLEVGPRCGQLAEEAAQRCAQIVQEIEERRAALASRIEQERDERVREIAQRVANNLNAVKGRVLANFSHTLDRLEVVLTNITTAVDRAEARGADVSQTRELIIVAEDEINDARATLNVLLEEDYVPDFEEGDSLPDILQTMRDLLHEDLRSAREAVLEAKEAVTSVVRELDKATPALYNDL